MNENYMDVLVQYEEEVTHVRRGRGAWICERADGVKLLKEYKGTLKRLEIEAEVLQAVRDGGLPQVDQYIANKEGNLLSIAGDGTKYILKDWYLDRECNLREPREILFAISRLAALHTLLRQVKSSEDWTLGSILPVREEEEMARHNRELQRARNYISKKRKKSEFELCVMENYSMFSEQAHEAQRGLELLQKTSGQDRLFLCHGDLNQHRVLFGNGYVAFIEFNKMHLGVQMEDLYHFMRKVMEKQNWNEHLGLSMIEAYDAVLPISDMEKQWLYYMFLYPEKYWKQLNYYINANKAWIPARNVEKLRILEQQQDGRNRFLSKIK